MKIQNNVSFGNAILVKLPEKASEYQGFTPEYAAYDFAREKKYITGPDITTNLVSIGKNICLVTDREERETVKAFGAEKALEKFLEKGLKIVKYIATK